MKNNLIPAIRLTLVCLLFFCGIYTLTVFGISKLVPDSMSFAKNNSGYYENVGQRFSRSTGKN
jgi:K+-transporting ATPase ATPase C chain